MEDRMDKMEDMVEDRMEDMEEARTEDTVKDRMEDTVEDRKCHKPMAFVSIPEVDVFVLTSIRKNPIK